jgi:chromosome segregation ATPase
VYPIILQTDESDEPAAKKYKKVAVNNHLISRRLSDKVDKLLSENSSLQEKVRTKETSQEEQEHQHQRDVYFLENKIKSLSTEMEQLGQMNSIQIRMFKNKLGRLERENTELIRSQRHCQDHIETLGKENKYLRDLMELLTDMFDFTIETGPNGSVRIVLDGMWKDLVEDCNNV